MIGSWLGYGRPSHPRARKRTKPRPRPKPRPRRVRRGPMETRQRAYRFLLFAAPATVLLFGLTVSHVSPLAPGGAQLRTIGVLPMLGFVVLFAAVVVAAGVVWALREPRLARITLIAGLVAAAALTLAVSNVMRVPLLTRVGHRAGSRLADRTAEEHEE